MQYLSSSILVRGTPAFMKGYIKRFDPVRRFGFIRSSENQNDYFFLPDSLKSSHDRSNVGFEKGALVSFDPIAHERGPRATNIVVEKRPSRAPHLFFALSMIFLTGGGMTVAMVMGALPWVWSYLLAINFASFILFTYDKSIAMSNATRVPEYIVLSAALIGGSLGVFLSQQIFRHKVRKRRFQFVLLLIFALQLALIKLWKTGTLF